MDFILEEKERHSRFLYRKEGRELAEMVFHWSGPEKMVIDHTEVDESLKGQGVGQALVARAVEYAREKGAKIRPLCTYAKHIMNKTPEYSDVLIG